MPPKFKHSTKWCVVTGVSSSGKTSVINELNRLNYSTRKESPREAIEEYMSTGKTVQDVIDNPAEVQPKILEKLKTREGQLDKDKLVFLDRGIPDTIGYFTFFNLDSTEIKKLSLTYRYNKVFYLEALPFVNDGLRIEDKKSLKTMRKLLKADYKELEYEFIRVPVMTVQDRVKFILSKMEETNV